jgi:phage terminase large subunit
MAVPGRRFLRCGLAAPVTAAALVHRYAPIGAAAELFRRRDGELLLSGPAGTGKSRAALEKINAAMMKYPDARGLMLRKTQVSLTSSGLVTYRKHVAAEAIRSGMVSFYGGSAQEAAQYRYDNGSTITLGGLDKASRVMSTEYDMVFVQEATELTLDDWEAVTTRLRNGVMPYQQLISDANPGVPHHWLKQRCDAGQTVLLESRHEDNPVLYRGGVLTAAGRDYIGKLDALTGVRYQRLRRGLWVAAEGLIYEEFDPVLNVCDAFVPPKDWPRYWVVDFGFTNPFVCQFWAEDPDGRLYMYKEIYRTRRLVEDHAKDILAVMDARPYAIICDHDAEDRATLERHLLMSTRAATKNVSEGIQAVAVRLRPQADGRARLVFCRDAVVRLDQALKDVGKPQSTLEEIVGYIWDTGNGKQAKEQPLKVDDHGMDCTRYMTAEKDLGRTPRYRSFRM